MPEEKPLYKLFIIIIIVIIIIIHYSSFEAGNTYIFLIHI